MDVDENKLFEDLDRPTTGVHFITTTIQKKVVELCDIDGHSSFSTLNLKHFKEANGIIAVFDVNIRSSFENALSLILEIKKTAKIDNLPKVFLYFPFHSLHIYTLTPNPIQIILQSRCH
jgi:GTPase SAR1 family protein